MIRIALDTNVLAYAEGINDSSKQSVAINLVRRLPNDSTILPVQVLGELFRVLVRKGGKAPKLAGKLVLGWHDAFTVVDTSASVMLSAIELAENHKLGIWDAIILAAAASAGCRFLLSEDLHNGFTWSGVTVANPFLDSKPPMLEAVLDT